jgi:hypothetical protein
MSELAVGSLKGLAANAFKIEVASGSQIVQPGAILQVVSTTKTDTFSASVGGGGTVAVTGMSATITPSSTSSKILVFTNLNVATDSGTNSISHIVKRNGTPIGVGDAASSRTQITGSSGTGQNYLQNNSSSNVLDSPSTTSAVTYSVDIHNTRGAGVTLYANRTALDTNSSDYTRAASSITLMEVAG